MAEAVYYCKRYGLRIVGVFISLLLLTVATFYPAVLTRSHYVLGGPHGTDDVEVVDEYSGWWYRCQLETNTNQLVASANESEGSHGTRLFSGWFHAGRKESFRCESITTTTFTKYHRQGLETDSNTFLREFYTSRTLFICGLVFTCTSIILHIIIIVLTLCFFLIAFIIGVAAIASIMLWLSTVILYLNIELIHPAMDLGLTTTLLLLLSIYHLTLVMDDVHWVAAKAWRITPAEMENKVETVK